MASFQFLPRRAQGCDNRRSTRQCLRHYNAEILTVCRQNKQISLTEKLPFPLSINSPYETNQPVNAQSFGFTFKLFYIAGISFTRNMYADILAGEEDT